MEVEIYRSRVKSSCMRSAEIEAARSRARALSLVKTSLEEPGNGGPRVLPWEARALAHTKEFDRVFREHHSIEQTGRQAYHISSHEDKRISSSRQLKGHHRAIITPRPAYKRSLNAANCELKKFQEKFQAWKKAYDREIGKTKASLASMTPALQGIGLAARIHKIVERATESLNATPIAGTATPTRTTAPTTPRASTLETESPSLEPLQLNHDPLSSSDEFLNFVEDEEIPLAKANAEKLAEVTDDIDVLTTIIEKKIFATRLPTVVDHEVNEDDVPVDLCGWSDGGLTSRTLTIASEIPTTLDEEEFVKDRSPSRLRPKLPMLKVEEPPKPVNLRDNLIMLAKQKGFTDIPASHGDGNIGVTTSPSERERAMVLLRKLYAPALVNPVPLVHLLSPEPRPAEEKGKEVITMVDEVRRDAREGKIGSSADSAVQQKVAQDVTQFRELFRSNSTGMGPKTNEKKEVAESLTTVSEDNSLREDTEPEKTAEVTSAPKTVLQQKPVAGVRVTLSQESHHLVDFSHDVTESDEDSLDMDVVPTVGVIDQNLAKDVFETDAERIDKFMNDSCNAANLAKLAEMYEDGDSGINF